MIYLDPMVDHGKRIGRAGPEWCHMIADTIEELHAFAERLGFRRSWFQGDSDVPHYDIGTEGKRELAVSLGAVECDRRTFVAHVQRLRASGWGVAS